MAAAYSARGASGFGAAVALPLLGLVLPLKLLVPAWTLIAAVAGTTILGSDRDKVLWWEILKLIPGTLIGVALGLAVTLVWLYTEILRLLSYFYSSD